MRGDINASRSLARVSMEADLTFRALVVAVDDYGRMEADALMLKAQLYPRRESVGPALVRQWVEELAAEGCVLLYTVAGVEYLQLTGWEKHRGRTNRAKWSRCPAPQEEDIPAPKPPGDSRESREIPSEIGVESRSRDRSREKEKESGEGEGAGEGEPSSTEARAGRLGLLSGPPAALTGADGGRLGAAQRRLEARRRRAQYE
jgi:hypothetical protein